MKTFIAIIFLGVLAITGWVIALDKDSQLKSALLKPPIERTIEVIKEVPVEVIKEVPIEVVREVIIAKPVIVEVPSMPRYIERLVEVRVPYDIPGDIGRLSSSQLLERLEYQRWTHQYALKMFKTGQWQEGSAGLGAIADQEALIDWYDRVIATVKWMVNQMEEK